MIKTSLQHLDDFLGGGLKRHSLTILSAKPGVENAPFAYTLMKESLKKGEKCIYVTHTKHSEMVENDIRCFGWDPKEYRDKKLLTFIDAFSGLVNEVPREEHYALDPRDIESVKAALKKALEAKGEGHALIVYDSLSTLMDHCGEKSVESLQDLKKTLRDHDATCIFLFTEWPYEDEVLSKLVELADAVINFRSVEKDRKRHKYMTVSKASWTKEKDRCIKLPFKVRTKGGLMSLESE